MYRNGDGRIGVKNTRSVIKLKMERYFFLGFILLICDDGE